jgi:hypothetical protein
MQGRPEEESIVVYHSRAKMAMLAVGALLFMLSALPLIYTGLHTGGFGLIISTVTATLNILFFGTCMLYALRRSGYHAPALTIDSHGIYDDSSGISAGFVPWDDIEGVFEAQVQYQRFLCILPKDVEAFLLHQPAWKRRMMRANFGLVGAPIAISAITLPISLTELIDTIDAHMHPHA